MSQWSDTQSHLIKEDQENRHLCMLLYIYSMSFEISGVHVGAKRLRADVRLMGCELFWAQTIQDDTGAPHILQERQKRAAKMRPEFLVETAPECVLIKLL